MLCGLAAALLSTATGCGSALVPDGAAAKERERVIEAITATLELPLPREGQTAIAVDSLGALDIPGTQRPVPIASVTKVMTAYVILKDHPLKDGADGPLITVDGQAAAEALSLSESTAPVTEGEQLSQRKLLELMLLPSANNVARLLARWDAGSQEKFVARMNDEAAGLGMKDTTYTGASGIESTTRSTATDQLKLAREAMKDPALRTTVALRSTTLPGRATPVMNTNTLLDRAGVIGLKTGSSTPAGGNLVWAAEIVDGAKSRLVYGVVLGQRTGSPPAEGKAAAVESSGRILDALQRKLPAALAAQGGGRI
ncbi:D-alanyl-D-alanine carboxypeptidase [Streptomyces sp. NPDC050738]|uniref:D-alanyl-D-alanine carboxypeptidase family protein n=1 Tax=Streptomyces sp. NPDC050738 TaxID=3154744 RepID=UPI00341EAF74